VDIQEAMEQSLSELGFNLADGNDLDIPEATVEEAGDGTLEDGGGDTGQPEATEESEDTAQPEDVAELEGEEIPLSEDAVLVLPDGSRVPSKDVILFQKDYTKKTQQVAEERRRLESEREEFDDVRQQVEQTYNDMREWYESRVQDRTAWIQEIVSESENPTATIARAIYEMAQAGKLDPAFVETFGLDAGDVAEIAKESSRDAEIAELRRKVEEREQGEAQAAAVQRYAAQYQQQWEAIKADRGLQFESPDAEVAAKREVLKFALDNNITRSLIDAYDLMRVRTGEIQSPEEPSAPQADPEIVAKKKASRAVTPRSAVGGVPAKAKPRSTRDAALQSLDEFLARA